MAEEASVHTKCFEYKSGPVSRILSTRRFLWNSTWCHRGAYLYEEGVHWQPSWHCTRNYSPRQCARYTSLDFDHSLSLLLLPHIPWNGLNYPRKWLCLPNNVSLKTHVQSRIKRTIIRHLQNRQGLWTGACYPRWRSSIGQVYQKTRLHEVAVERH